MLCLGSMWSLHGVALWLRVLVTWTVATGCVWILLGDELGSLEGAGGGLAATLVLGRMCACVSVAPALGPGSGVLGSVRLSVWVG